MSKLPKTDNPIVEIDGQRYVCVRESEFKKLQRQVPAGHVEALPYAAASIGRDLRARRLAAGLSQAQVARRAGIRLETLCRLEKGRTNPTVGTVRRLLKVLGA